MGVSGHSGRGRAPPGAAATSEEGVVRWSDGSPSGVSVEWGHKKWPKAHWCNDERTGIGGVTTQARTQMPHVRGGAPVTRRTTATVVRVSARVASRLGVRASKKS